MFGLLHTEAEITVVDLRCVCVCVIVLACCWPDALPAAVQCALTDGYLPTRQKRMFVCSCEQVEVAANITNTMLPEFLKVGKRLA
jgi:hypothetical protein